MADKQKTVEIGRVTHYFAKVGVAVIELKEELSVGDEILIEGPGINVVQKVVSMEIEHKGVQKAVSGQSIGLKVDGRVTDACKVYRIAR